MTILKNIIVLFLLLCLTAFSTAVIAEGKKANIRVSPLGLLLGMTDLTIDIGVKDAVTVGPHLTYMNWNKSNFEFMYTGYGLRANYYFSGKRFEDGFYFGPSVDSVSFKFAGIEPKKDKDDPDGEYVEAEGSGYTMTAVLGYQWMWESFNINLGIGYNYSSIKEITATTKTGEEKEIDAPNKGGKAKAIEFTLGWAI